MRAPLTRLGCLLSLLGLVLLLSVAPSAQAAGGVYWANNYVANSGTGTIGRANLDGSGANQSETWQTGLTLVAERRAEVTARGRMQSSR